MERRRSALFLRYAAMNRRTRWNEERKQQPVVTATTAEAAASKPNKTRKKKKKQYRYECIAEGCSKIAQNRGVCINTERPNYVKNAVMSQSIRKMPRSFVVPTLSNVAESVNGMVVPCNAPKKLCSVVKCTSRAVKKEKCK